MLDPFKSCKVSPTQLKILKEKTLLNEKSGFICEDCLAKYAKSYLCDKTNPEAMPAQGITIQVCILKQFCYASHSLPAGYFYDFFLLF